MRSPTGCGDRTPGSWDAASDRCHWGLVGKALGFIGVWGLKGVGLKV